MIELFAGIGSQAKALKNLKIPIIHHRVVEWDKYAIKSYNAIHNTNFETSDITKIKGEDLGITETNKYNYLMTYSFPCQDLSKAGKGKGMTKGDNTRSGLLWEIERLLRECKELPQYLLMENVPDVIGQKNIKDFAMWCEFLESIGYRNFYQLLNAKDYGIPQNRKRCFMISILKSKNQIYQFPKPIPLTLKLADMLEEEVDEKYFLSEKMLTFFIKNSDVNEKKGNGFRFKPVKKENADIAKTITTRNGSRMDDNFIEVFDFRHDEGVRGRVDNDLSPTITTKAGSKGLSGQPLLKIPEATKKGYAEAEVGDGVYINRPHQKRGVVQKGKIQTIKTSPNDVGVVVRDTRNLKEKLCDELIQSGIVKGGEIINHSYTNSKKNPNGRLELEDFVETRDGIVPTLTTRPDTLGVVIGDNKKVVDEYPSIIQKQGDDVVVIGNYSPSGHHASRIVDKNGLSPTVMENHGTVTAVVVGEKEYSQKSLEKIKNNIKDVNGLSNTITANPQRATIDNATLVVVEEHRRDEGIRTFKDDAIGTLRAKEAGGDKVVVTNQPLRIRKLTPKECWRLMGFSDEDFDKASKVNSNSQLYKQAGNSIVVNVLMEIFKKMFIDTSIDNYQTNIFDFIEEMTE